MLSIKTSRCLEKNQLHQQSRYRKRENTTFALCPRNRCHRKICLSGKHCCSFQFSFDTGHVVHTSNFRVGRLVESILAQPRTNRKSNEITGLGILRGRPWKFNGGTNLGEMELFATNRDVSWLPWSFDCVPWPCIGAILAVFRDPHTIAGKKGRYEVNQGWSAQRTTSSVKSRRLNLELHGLVSDKAELTVPGYVQLIRFNYYYYYTILI